MTALILSESDSLIGELIPSSQAQLPTHAQLKLAGSAVTKSEFTVIKAMEEILAKFPQIPMEPEHFYSDNCVVRQLAIPAGTLIIGKLHKTRHFCQLIKGVATIWREAGPVTMEAPCLFDSQPGTKRMIYVHEDCIFQTIHVSSATDIPTLEAETIAGSPEEMAALFKQIGLVDPFIPEPEEEEDDGQDSLNQLMMAAECQGGV